MIWDMSDSLQVADPTGDATIAQRLLRDGVPLSLLCDLTDPHGPQSREILATEGLPTAHWWARTG
jgi:hypothetical protein